MALVNNAEFVYVLCVLRRLESNCYHSSVPFAYETWPTSICIYVYIFNVVQSSIRFFTGYMHTCCMLQSM